MADIPLIFNTPTIEYATNAYSGVDADVSTETVLAEIEFDGTHGAYLKFKVNSSGTTDSFVVRLYTSDDGIEWDTVIAQALYIVATGGSDVIASYIMPAPGPFMRVSGIRSGATDTFDVELTVATYIHAVQ